MGPVKHYPAGGGLTRLFGAVLTGGSSRRFGTDKAVFVAAGESMPWAQLGLEALRGVGANPVWSIGGAQDQLAHMGFAAVPDDLPGQGPLGGIATALRYAIAELAGELPREELEASSEAPLAAAQSSETSLAVAQSSDLLYRSAVFVLACDLPWVSPQTLSEVLAALDAATGTAADTAAQVVLPVDQNQRVQYLHGLWRLSCYASLQQALGAGERSVAGGLRYLAADAVVTCEVSQPQTLADIDEPGGLAGLGDAK